VKKTKYLKCGWTMNPMDENFEFYMERSGRDCDGEYFHGGKSSVMSRQAIYELLGEFVATYSVVTRENGEHWNTWHFRRDTDEGYDYVQLAVKFHKEVREWEGTSNSWNSANTKDQSQAMRTGRRTLKGRLNPWANSIRKKKQSCRNIPDCNGSRIMLRANADSLAIGLKTAPAGPLLNASTALKLQRGTGSIMIGVSHE
jgi:hypothetical protein